MTKKLCSENDQNISIRILVIVFETSFMKPSSWQIHYVNFKTNLKYIEKYIQFKPSLTIDLLPEQFAFLEPFWILRRVTGKQS